MTLYHPSVLPHLPILAKAMTAPEVWAVEIVYRDAQGDRTRRLISPIRFCGNSTMVALCLGREQPRNFDLRRCEQVRLRRSHELLMPVAIEQLDRSGADRLQHNSPQAKDGEADTEQGS